MDNKISKGNVQSKISTIVTDREFVLIFITFMQRICMLYSTVPSDISHLITMYADARSRIIWINNRVHKSDSIHVADGMTITKGESGKYGTVIFGHGGSLDRSRATKYEIAFRINEMVSTHGFFIGYVYGLIQNIDVDVALGVRSNEKNSVGIWLRSNGFYLLDQDHSFKKLKCETLPLSRFPKPGQFWRVSLDLIDNEMEISMMDQQGTDCFPMLHYLMKQEHRDVIPAFSLYANDLKRDSITLQRK